MGPRTILIFFFLLVLLCMLSSCATGSCLNEKGENVCRQNRIENIGNRGGRL